MFQPARALSLLRPAYLGLFALAIGAASSAETTKTPLLPVRYGAFTQTATYSVANQLGYFNAYGLEVTYLQTPNSTSAYNTTLDCGYDIFTGAVDNNINIRFNQGRNLTTLAQLDEGPDLVFASVPSIKTIADLKGKSILVDSPLSGFAYVLRKVLALYGLTLEDGDYTFVTVGGTNIRYELLVNGTYNGSAVYASILTYPYTAYGQDLRAGQRLNALFRVSDYVAPYPSTVFTIAESALANATARDLSTRFIAAMHDANRFLASTSQSSQTCSVNAIAKQLNISTELAQKEFVAATNPVSGETVPAQKGNFTVDRLGLLNVIDARQQFGGFAAVPRGFNFADAVLPGKGKLIDYSILTAALAMDKNFQPKC